MADWKKVTVELDHPITLDDKQVSTLTFREPNVEQMEEIDELELPDGKNPSVKQIRRVAEILGDLPDGALLKMNKNDFRRVSEESFLELLRDTVETPETE